MKPGANNERVYRMAFASLYPHYVNKVEKSVNGERVMSKASCGCDTGLPIGSRSDTQWTRVCGRIAYLVE